jgi:cellulose biosynthesis protein BcsQ
MGRFDWLELGKIAAAIVTVVTPIAGYLWRQLRTMSRRNDKLKAQLRSKEHHHQRLRAVWKVRIQAELDRQKSIHRRRLNDKNHELRTAKDEVASISAAVSERDQLIKRQTARIGELQQTNRRLIDEARAIDQVVQQLRGDIARHEANESSLTQELLVSKTMVDDLSRQANETAARLSALTEQHAELSETLSKRTAENEELESRIESIFKLDGRLWNVPVSPNVAVAEFRRLANRNMPIVSVLNFKGGVGKTSISANLAAYLGQNGKRTLMIDLDYQRSLSQLVLTDAERRKRQLELRCLQHFLAGDDHSTRHFLDFAHRIDQGMGTCWIVPNSNPSEVRGKEQNLEETENRLMADWMIRRDERDVRFFLRESLHGIGIESHFDFVILDCPPRLTTSTINALAASDFVLVPTVLDPLSANSVTPLVKSLREFRPLFPQLKLLGVVGNQSKLLKGKPVREENAAWEKLQAECRGLFADYPVHFFETVIPLHRSFGKICTDDGPAPAIADETINSVFESLNAELQKEIARHAHSRASAVCV